VTKVEICEIKARLFLENVRERKKRAPVLVMNESLSYTLKIRGS
jgi:hypothetical protein